MDDSTKQLLTGLVRHGLTVLAGMLAVHGFAVDDGTVSLIAAAVVAVAGCGWSALQKKGVVKL